MAYTRQQTTILHYLYTLEHTIKVVILQGLRRAS